MATGIGNIAGMQQDAKGRDLRYISMIQEQANRAFGRNLTDSELDGWYNNFHGGTTGYKTTNDLFNKMSQSPEGRNWASGAEQRAATTSRETVTAAEQPNIAAIQAQFPDVGLTDKDWATAYQGWKGQGMSDADAAKFATQDLTEVAGEWMKNQAAEKQITDYVAQYPELAKTGIMGMDEALKASAQEYFTQQAQPQIEQSLNRRGILDSGGLNVALASELGNLNRQRESITQPMLAQSNLQGQQMQYENLLRQAQQAGINLTAPSVFQQQYGAQNYGAAQQQMQNEAQMRLQKQQQDYNEAYQNRMAQQQQNQMLQAMLGSVGGSLLGGTLGAAFLPTDGGLTRGQGFMSGYTGQLYPDYNAMGNMYKNMYGGMSNPIAYNPTAGVGSRYGW